MKMNNKLFLALFLFLLVMGISEAGMLPYAASGYVRYNGIALSEVEISVENINEGISKTIFTTPEGFFLYALSDWGNDDQIRITACNTIINSACQQTKKIAVECPAMGGCDFNFDLTNPETIITKAGHTRRVTEFIYVCEDGTNVDDKGDCPVKPEVIQPPVVVEKYICWDKSEVSDLSKCPEKPEVIVKEYICEDGTKVESTEQCPEETSEWWYAIVSALIVIAASILAVKYKWGKGFLSLVTFWSKKDPKRAVKMLKTAIDKEKSGKYKE